MSIQIYILGKMIEKNTYPYQLKKELSDSFPLDSFTNLTESKLYYHFESLTKQGLIQPVEVIKGDHRPDKQIFSITEKGKKALPEKIYDLIDKAKTITDMIVGIVFIHLADRQKIISILEYKLTYLQRKEEKLQELRTKIDIPKHFTATVLFLDDYHQTLRSHEIESLKDLISKVKNNTL